MENELHILCVCITYSNYRETCIQMSNNETLVSFVNINKEMSVFSSIKHGIKEQNYCTNQITCHSANPQHMSIYYEYSSCR